MTDSRHSVRHPANLPDECVICSASVLRQVHDRASAARREGRSARTLPLRSVSHLEPCSQRATLRVKEGADLNVNR